MKRANHTHGTRVKDSLKNSRFLIVFALVLLFSFGFAQADLNVTTEGLIVDIDCENEFNDNMLNYESFYNTISPFPFSSSIKKWGDYACYDDVRRNAYWNETRIWKTANHSVCASLRPSSLNTQLTVFSFGDNSTPAYVNASSIYTYYGGYRVIAGKHNGTSLVVEYETSNGNYNANEWVTLCYTYNGDNLDDLVTLYIKNDTTNILKVNDNSTGSLYTWQSGKSPRSGVEIGSAGLGLNQNTYGHIGYFDNIQVYNTVLDEAQINNYMLYGEISENIPAYVNDISITPLFPLDNETLLATCNASDYEDDTILYFFEWIKNGVSVKNSSTGTNNTDTYDSLSYQDEVYVNCTVYDQTSNSTSFKSNTVTVDLNDYSPSDFIIYSPCSVNITLNSTGVTTLFNWSVSTSPASYPIEYSIYLENPVLTYKINDSINSTYSYETLLSYPTSTYDVLIESCDNESNCRNSSDECSIRLCTSSWVYHVTTCAYNGSSDVWGEQTVYYTDTNNCPLVYDLPLNNGTLLPCSLTEITSPTEEVSSKDVMVFVLYLIGIVGFLVVGFSLPPLMILSGILTVFFSFFVKNTLLEPTLFVIALIFGSLTMLVGVLYTFISARI